MSLKTNHDANVTIVLMAITAAVVIAVTLIVVFPLLGSLDTGTIDQDIQETLGEAGTTYKNTTVPAANATDNIVSQLEIFYDIVPLYIVVLAAVGIISAVMAITIVGRR